MRRVSAAVAVCCWFVFCLTAQTSRARDDKPNAGRFKDRLREELRSIGPGFQGLSDPFPKCQALIRLASAHQFVSDREEALSTLRLATESYRKLKTPNERFVVDVELATRYLELGERQSYDECERRAHVDLDQILEGDGDPFDAVMDLARIEIRANELDEARANLKKATELADRDHSKEFLPEHLVEIAAQCRRMGDQASATRLLERANKVVEQSPKPDQALLLTVLVEELARSAFFEEARQTIERPAFRDHLFNVVAILADRIDRKSVGLDPAFLDRLVLDTSQVKRPGNRDEVVGRVQDRQISRAKAFFALARAQARTDDSGDAQRTMNLVPESEGLSPEALETTIAIALARNLRGERDESRKLLRTLSARLQPINMVLRLARVAKAQAQIGDIEGATESIAAIAIEPIGGSKDEVKSGLDQVLFQRALAAKIETLAILSNTQADANHLDAAKKNFEEALRVLNNLQDDPSHKLLFDRPLGELAIAEYRVGKIKTALETVHKIKSVFLRERTRARLIVACSRNRDFAAIEQVIDQFEHGQRLLLQNAVHHEVEQGYTQNILDWAPRLKDRDMRLYVLIAVAEGLGSGSLHDTADRDGEEPKDLE